MAFCGKCGSEVQAGVKFCPSCGTAAGAPTAGQAGDNNRQADFTGRVQRLNNTYDSTGQYGQDDVAQNKVMAILAYFGPLVLVPILAAPQSRFARFHANQGLLLLIGVVAYGIVESILLALLGAIFPWDWSYGYLGGRGPIYNIIATVLALVWIIFSVLAIIGIINAAQGKAKDIPVIGQYRILK